MSPLPLKPEIVAPAGNLRKLRCALQAGADAVYLASPRYSLRKAADNFGPADLRTALTEVRRFGARAYLALNGMPLERDMSGLCRYLEDLAREEVQPDALIVSDPGVLVAARRAGPWRLHVSTQASVQNWRSCAFWRDLGAARVVVGREVSVQECAEIKQHADIEIESFVHGSMCTSNSGKCVISNYTAGRDANRGGCLQSCRYPFAISSTPEGPVEVSAHLMNSGDLMGLAQLPAMVLSGIDALKIEGRMKSEYYAATTARVYREALDHVYDTLSRGGELKPGWDTPWRGRLQELPHRAWTSGSLEERAFDRSLDFSSGAVRQIDSYVGHIRCESGGAAVIELKQALGQGEMLEVLEPRGRAQMSRVETLHDMQGRACDKMLPDRLARVRFSGGWSVGSMLRRPTVAQV